jgi:hypothetical protein
MSIGLIKSTAAGLRRVHRNAPLKSIEQQRSERSDAREFCQIQRFVAACRQHWPGAKIVLRPDPRQRGDRCNAPANPNLHLKEYPND